LWITFPDPQLGDKNEHNRVTNSKFIDIYKQLLKSDGKLCIKTDDAEFADYTRLVLRNL
jgi:tRNA (guanine-N7-)-methyltransferase